MQYQFLRICFWDGSDLVCIRCTLLSRGLFTTLIYMVESLSAKMVSFMYHLGQSDSETIHTFCSTTSTSVTFCHSSHARFREFFVVVCVAPWPHAFSLCYSAVRSEERRRSIVIPDSLLSKCPRSKQRRHWIKRWNCLTIHGYPLSCRVKCNGIFHIYVAESPSLLIRQSQKGYRPALFHYWCILVYIPEELSH